MEIQEKITLFLIIFYCLTDTGDEKNYNFLLLYVYLEM